MNQKFKRIVEQVSRFDLIVLFSVPLVLAIFFLLPTNVKNIFILTYSSPFSLGLFFTHYVHEDLTHFLGNLVVYLINIFLIYFLCLFGKAKREFYLMLFVFLMILPLLISTINVFALDYFNIQMGRSYGFSGINSALLGSVSFFVAASIKKILPRIKASNVILLMMFFVFGLEIIVYQAPVWMSILVWTAFIYYLYEIFKKMDLRKAISRFSIKDNNVSAILLIFITLALYAGVIIALFPENIQISENVNVDILSHYIGLTLGFVTALIFCFRFENKFKTKS